MLACLFAGFGHALSDAACAIQLRPGLARINAMWRKLAIAAGGVACGLVLMLALAIERSDGPMHTWMRADADLEQITNALHLYRLDHGEYPESLEQLTEQFPNGVPCNPYIKQAYDYTATDQRFFLVFYGKDDEPGGKVEQDRDIIYTERGRLGGLTK